MGRIADALKRAAEQDAPAGAGLTMTADLMSADGSTVVPPWDLADLVRDDTAPVVDVPMPVRGTDWVKPARPAGTLGPLAAARAILAPTMEPHTREAYRRLAAELHHQQVERGCKVVMVTSALPQEGKTLTILNLALTLSESFARRVLLVDADLRHPTLHAAFSLPLAPGLRDALRRDGRAHVVSVRPRLALLPAGTPNDDPMEALTSASMRELLSDARGTYDWLLVDTAPVGLLPDANLLASMVDSAIIVVAAAKTDYTLVQRAIDELGADRVLGIVLNRAQRPSRQYQDDSHRDHATPS